MTEPLALPKAVLWDMDGTLVDTEPYWIATEFELAERYGGTWSEAHALNLVGNDLRVSGAYIREHMGIDLEVDEIVEALLDGVVRKVEENVPWRPGAVDLVERVRAAGIPCALVTMSYDRFVAPILAQLPPETFRVVVTGDRVEQGKPHPEPYLTAAAALGLRAGRLPGDRGLQHRREVRRGGRLPGARGGEPRAGAADRAPGLRRHPRGPRPGRGVGRQPRD